MSDSAAAWQHWAMRASLAILSLAALFLAALAPAGPAAAELLPAPHQVSAVVQYRGDHFGAASDLMLGDRLVVVDFGTAMKRPPPARDEVQEITVIGTQGALAGQLLEIVKRCDYLCGDEGEECHYEAVYRLAGAPEALGTPLAALVGRHEVGAFSGPLQAAAEPTAALPAFEASGDPLPPAWTPHPADRPAYRIGRWDPAAGSLALDLRYGDGEVTRFEDSGCSALPSGALTALACGSLATLLSGGRVLLLSFPDYNVPAAEVVARFQSGGVLYHLVRLGLKAQTVFGLLFQDGGAWRARFEPRDYALLC